MKTKTPIPLNKRRTPPLKSMAPETTGVVAMPEAIALPGVGLSIPVRAAKAKLSALLEMVAGGTEVTITSDGVPKAVLSPVGKHKAQKVFSGTWEHLKKMPPWRGGPTATEIIRAERDSRP